MRTEPASAERAASSNRLRRRDIRYCRFQDIVGGRQDQRNQASRIIAILQAVDFTTPRSSSLSVQGRLFR
ncbi:hypothetical protein ACWDUL_29770 [Nocardia niigatensis]